MERKKDVRGKVNPREGKQGKGYNSAKVRGKVRGKGKPDNEEMES